LQLDTPVVAYNQLAGEPMQVFAFRVQSAIIENTGTEIPPHRLFRHVVSGMHSSLRAMLIYPPPLTLGQLFSWYDDIVPTLDPSDEFAIALKPKPTETATSIVEQQNPDLTVRLNASGSCYKCGEPGHFAVFCDRKRNGSLRGKRRNRKRRQRGCKRVTSEIGVGVYKGRVSKM